MSFYQLFIANLRMLYRNWRGLFWNIALPIILYVAIGTINIPILGQNDYNRQYLLPGMIALTLLQTGIFSLSYWLVDLKSRGVLRRFAVTPLSSTELVGSLILSRIVLMYFQVALITAIGWEFFHTTIRGSWLAIAALVLLGGIIFLSIGFFISTISNSYEEASPITTIINVIFIFLGNIFFPSEILPGFISVLSKVIPITYLVQGLRANFNTTVAFSASLKDLAILLGWVIIIFGVTVTSFKIQQE